jgi:hypothetical protein
MSFTGWANNHAMPNKCTVRVRPAIKLIVGQPFPMTRSRSYHKNDNARAKQKNWTHVRQLFGYDRIDDERLVDLMNEIYEVQNLIQNFFIPQYELKSKVRLGAKIKKKNAISQRLPTRGC